MTTESSKLWADITSSLFKNIDNDFINSFRKPGGGANTRLAAWDPYDKSMRWYKFLLYNCANSKSLNFFDAYKKITNVSIGSPVSININGADINIDHFFAVEEALFILEHKNDIKSVVEIGAGFGRTCQALLCINPTIESYTIIDLPEILNLSRTYLKKAVPNFFDKIKFVENIQDIKNLNADLSINIDSFQEMIPATIDTYMEVVISNSKSFYCKNPTGKYLPSHVGLQQVKPEQLKDAYSLGYCRDVFDLFNQADLEISAKKYLAAYLPPSAGGASGAWKLVADQAMVMFPQYHHALYCRS